LNPGMVPNDESTIKDIHNLDRVVMSHTVGTDMMLNRGFATKYLAQSFGTTADIMHNLSDEELQKYVGQQYTENAFSSTSMDKNWSNSFSNATVSGKTMAKIRITGDSPGYRFGGGE